MQRSVLLMIILLLTMRPVWAEPTQQQPTRFKEGDTLAFYDKDWRLASTKVSRGFYRQLLKVDSQGYLVQDFYVDTDTKQTDPFWISRQAELTAAKVTHQDIALMIWFPNGAREEQYTYQDGMLKNVVGWYQSGQKRYEGSFKNDKREGKWTGWFRNGQLNWQGTFVEGNKQGQWHFWHPSGQLSAQGEYDNNLKQDMWIYWDRQGKKIKEEQYKDNEKIAQWTNFEHVSKQ